MSQANAPNPASHSTATSTVSIANPPSSSSSASAHLVSSSSSSAASASSFSSSSSTSSVVSSLGLSAAESFLLPEYTNDVYRSSLTHILKNTQLVLECDVLQLSLNVGVSEDRIPHFGSYAVYNASLGCMRKIGEEDALRLKQTMHVCGKNLSKVRDDLGQHLNMEAHRHLHCSIFSPTSTRIQTRWRDSIHTSQGFRFLTEPNKTAPGGLEVVTTPDKVTGSSILKVKEAWGAPYKESLLNCYTVTVVRGHTAYCVARHGRVDTAMKKNHLANLLEVLLAQMNEPGMVYPQKRRSEMRIRFCSLLNSFTGDQKERGFLRNQAEQLASTTVYAVDDVTVEDKDEEFVDLIDEEVQDEWVMLEQGEDSNRRSSFASTMAKKNVEHAYLNFQA
eukprot:NODE_641_length_1476_cov_70.274001_g478_i0.p1 GENE.NODE_641_length_1476_cov_70.274001_g478_i0~~NODE_641_length_1476_cov_70.274001_g478_i0.p1  ORF type:complete len:391 (-),score=95.48 NODE_641_length_1476_cov_70.274001_g478_i0:193-1365(-)